MSKLPSQEAGTVRKPRTSKSSQTIAAKFAPNADDSFGSSLDDAAMRHRFRLISGCIVKQGDEFRHQALRRGSKKLLARRAASGKQEASGTAGDRGGRLLPAQDQARLEGEWGLQDLKRDRPADQYTTSDDEALFVTPPPPTRVNRNRRRVSAQLHEQIIELPRRAEKRHLSAREPGRAQAESRRASVRQDEKGSKIILEQDADLRLVETTRLGGERLRTIRDWLDAVTEGVEEDDGRDYIVISDDE